MKVLVVDDDLENRDMLEQFLEASSFEVTVVNGGKKGIELIQNKNFDKILLDIAMPEVNGIDVVDELSNQKFTDFNKIIIMTALELTNTEKDALKSYGVKKILSKPLNMPSLVEELRK